MAVESVAQDEEFLGPNRQYLDREEISAVWDIIYRELDRCVRTAPDMSDRDFITYLDATIYKPDGLRDRTRKDVLAVATRKKELPSALTKFLPDFDFAAGPNRGKTLIMLVLLIIAIPLVALAARRNALHPGTFRLSCILLIAVVLLAAYLFRERSTQLMLDPPPEAERRNIYFVKPLVDAEYFPAVLADIRAARESIYVSLYLLQRERKLGSQVNLLADELANAVRRGVRVCVLLERNPDVDRYNRAAGSFLAASGVTVVYDGANRSTHEKIVMIDRQIVFVANHNWSPAALARNGEVAVRIATPRMPDELLQYFYTWFPDEAGRESAGLFREVADPNAIRAHDVVFLKDGAYSAALQERLHRARKSILVVMYYIKKTDRSDEPVSELLAELADATRRKLDVQVVLDDNIRDRNEEVRAWLTRHGVPVAYDNNARIMHTKLVIIDDRYVILGSHNWTPSAFNSNAELSVCILSPTLARLMAAKLTPG